ncbi:uncharacterized protein LOC113873811 [Abrus precatorius]|uniref:Uncharacterized protein LOC113873811 n=1 Tax=Abrus precatorius TaxID=3816 RepID=A0A8B8MK22_ABRPR|nr:uncharacterized protein LOC113873811 [Abrus precatorius]
MATVFKILSAILFLTLVNKGSSSCSLNNINIGSTRSGREIQGKPEWNVVVINNCSCIQRQIQLACRGFQSAESVSPSILSKEGDSCLLINGNPLSPFATVRFSYAWDPPFVLVPTSSILGPCS